MSRAADLWAMLPLIGVPMMISAGQILFKQASGTAGLLHGNQIVSLLSNPWLVVALVIYFAATLWWVVVLRTTPLNQAYGFMALSFVYVPLLSALVLREQVGWRVMLGGAVIVLGIVIAASGDSGPRSADKPSTQAEDIHGRL